MLHGGDSLFLLKAIGNFLGDIFEFISSTLGSVINGLIVGVFSFIDGVLSSIEHISSIITHLFSSVINLISSFLTLGSSLFPFIPAEIMALIESALVVLAIGLIIRKKVVG